MNYIDKSINEIAGKAIVDELLADSWDANQYSGADYNDGLKKPKYKSRFTDLLSNGQNKLCCYCMKEIGTDITLEHIIPHRVSNADFDLYLVVAELTNNVIHKDNFDRYIRIIPPAMYPHDIAYHNLIASCDSNTHCNHYRGDKYIYPFMYNQNIGIMVEYDNQGNAYCPDYIDELAKVGISTNQELKMYRKIWQELAKEKDNPDDITDEDIELIVLTLDDTKNEKLLTNFYGNPSKKPDLLKYKWFFHYYKNH